MEQYEQQQTEKLAAGEKAQITTLKDSIAATAATDTCYVKKLYLHLSEIWKTLNKPAVGAFYYYQYLQKQEKSTGKCRRQLCGMHIKSTDSIISNNLITFALRSYEKRLYKKTPAISICKSNLPTLMYKDLLNR